MDREKLNVDKAVIIRTILTFVAVFNLAANAFGWVIIPLDEFMLAPIVDAALVVASAAVLVWSWWKNNSFTDAAIVGDYAQKAYRGGSAIEYEREGVEVEWTPPNY